mgnify:CR=1 FL=1
MNDLEIERYYALKNLNLDFVNLAGYGKMLNIKCGILAEIAGENLSADKFNDLTFELAMHRLDGYRDVLKRYREDINKYFDNIEATLDEFGGNNA